MVEENPNLICRHGGGSRIDGVSSVCLCGKKSILRTARTPKNRGKQFWSCPKYKVKEHECYGISF